MFEFDPADIQRVKLAIAESKAAFKPMENLPSLSLKPDRSKSGDELAQELFARLEEVGLKTDDVLLRFVDDPQYVHKPTARTIDDIGFLSLQLGVNEYNATWASEVYPGSTLNIGSDSPAKRRSYMVFLKDALIRVDRIGSIDVARPFYVFRGRPHSAVVAKIYDGGLQPLEMPCQKFLQQSDEQNVEPMPMRRGLANKLLDIFKL